VAPASGRVPPKQALELLNRDEGEAGREGEAADFPGKPREARWFFVAVTIQTRSMAGQAGPSRTGFDDAIDGQAPCRCDFAAGQASGGKRKDRGLWQLRTCFEEKAPGIFFLVDDRAVGGGCG